MSDESPEISQRYISTELQASPDAKILHFKPDSTDRDEFGNRAFSSPLSYVDRENRKTKAAILVSSEGEELIKTNKGILKAIDQGLQAFTKKIESQEVSLWEPEKPSINIGEDRTLTWIDSGGQSDAFVLQIGERKYVIQTNTSHKAKFTNYSQPYINEMLQTQELQAQLKKDLEEAEVELSHFLFATPYVSCTKYMPGSESITRKDLTPVYNVLRKAVNYVSSKHDADDPLWKNVGIDINPGLDQLPGKNMLQREDKLIWLDPFYHKTDWEVYGKED